MIIRKMRDISVSIHEGLPTWPGESPVAISSVSGNSVLVTRAAMSLHAGTHMDAPLHFIPGGKRLDEYPLERFIGPAYVCEIKDTRSISLSEIKEKDLKGHDRILFKTRNSGLWSQNAFATDFMGLDLDAAQYLIGLGVKLLGNDYLSIEAYGSKDNPVHKALLGNDVLILEGLNLAGVAEGQYQLISFPLKFAGAEASPVRAVLF